MSAAKIITGFMIGAAAGAVLGILFAPDKGSETRKKISQKGNDLADSLKDKFNDFVDGVSDKFHGAKHETADRAGKGNQHFEEWKGNV